MNISLIVAYDNDKCIGKENTIPWKQKDDLKRLQKLTTNQTIIMGRKTLESLGRGLPNRENRVLSSDLSLADKYENIKVYNSIDDILKDITTEKVFIFGGEAIYKIFFDIVDEMFVTEIDANIKGDAFFLDFNKDNWEIVFSEKHKKDINNDNDYNFIIYKKKGK